MQDFELEQLRRNPSWTATLKTYLELANSQRQNDQNFDGWIPRVATVPEVETAKLSSVHGRLIAFGFLKFDLSDRHLGMRYQLTPFAKQALGAAEPAELQELAESA